MTSGTALSLRLISKRAYNVGPVVHPVLCRDHLLPRERTCISPSSSYD